MSTYTTLPLLALAEQPAPRLDWYAPLREIKSMGSQAARPGSLAGLHQARQEHLGQFFTPDALVAFIWRLLTPSMEKAVSKQWGKVALFDNSVGCGRLMQFADPEKHHLGGVDVHGETVTHLTEVAEQAGFDCQFQVSGMEWIRPRNFNVGLINPPFSLHLDSPTLSPYPCTTWGKFGPNTGAISHAYALFQALDCCEVVAAILPRSYAVEVQGDPNLNKRLVAVFHAPTKSFAEEATAVQTSILIFDYAEKEAGEVLVQSLASLDEPAPSLSLTIGTTRHYSPKLGHCELDDEQPTITLPVTADNTVRVAHNSRRIVLKFACGLTQAKVMNGLYRSRIFSARDDGQRLPHGVLFSGQGKLDIEVHLAQDAPLSSFSDFLHTIRQHGGEPSVDDGLWKFIGKRAREIQKQRVPFRHVIYQPGPRLSGKPVSGVARQTFLVQPGVWGSPVVKAGDSVRLAPISESEFDLVLGGKTYRLGSDETQRYFEIEGGEIDENPWVVKHSGRLVAFPEQAQALRKKAIAAGIDKWLSWDYQLDDLLELFIGPTGAVVAWDMGLGKARLALALALFSGCQHGLVVVEAHLIPEMETELAMLPIAADLWQTIKTPDQAINLKRINIISYNRLRSSLYGQAESRHTYARKMRRRIGTLIADEGHLLRNPQSKQCRALAMVAARKRFILTGTPVANYPRDIHPLLAYVSGDGTAAQPYGFRRGFLETNHHRDMSGAVRGVDAFREHFVTLEWCTNEFAETLREGAKREIPKIQNLSAYRAAMAHHVKRRLSIEPEVAAHFTIPTPIEREVSIAWDEPHLQYYLTVCEDFYSWYTNHKREADARRKNINLIAVLARINAVRMANNYPQHGVKGFGVYSHLTAKQRWAIDRLETLTGEGHKTILYADNPGCLELLGGHLLKRGIESVVMHGQKTIKDRTIELNERFRFGKVPVLLASLGVTQTGLNIPQASRGIFLCRSWTHKTEEQAKKRLLRPQQKQEVEFEYAHHRGSIDIYQGQMVDHKRDSAFAGLDYATPVYDDVEFLHLDTILGRFCVDVAHMFNCKPHDLKKYLKAA